MYLKRILVGLLFLLINTVSNACDCVMIVPVTAYVPKSDYILVVKARDIHKDGDAEINQYYPGIKAQVEVVSVIKGGISAGKKLEFAPHEVSNCSFQFLNDHTYLIFAYKDGDHFSVYNCSWSGDITDKRVRNDIKKLKKYMRRHR